MGAVVTYTTYKGSLETKNQKKTVASSISATNAIFSLALVHSVHPEFYPTSIAM